MRLSKVAPWKIISINHNGTVINLKYDTDQCLNELFNFIARTLINQNKLEHVGKIGTLSLSGGAPKTKDYHNLS